MSDDKFCFTDRQRKQLIAAALQKQAVNLVDTFLGRCEDAITEWQRAWPVKTEITAKRGVRDGLNKLATQLNKLRCSIHLLPKDAACAVWANWNRDKGLPISDLWKSEQDVLCLITELENSVLNLQVDISTVGGISKACESELITELADVYAWTFHKLPSAAPNGVFMHFVGALTDVIRRPDGKPFVAGKDLVATALKRKSALRKYYLSYRVD